MDEAPPPRPPRLSAPRLREALPLLLLALAAGIWFHAGRDPLRDTRADIDEAEWISISVHTFQLLFTGISADAGATPEELAAVEEPWKEGIQSSTFGWMNPLLPKLVFGLVAHAGGHRVAHRDVYPRFIDGDKQTKGFIRQRTAERFVPALGAARKVTVVLAALCAALLFAIGRRLGGALTGTLAYGLWLLSPAVREASVHVRTDLFPLAFSLLALTWVLVHADLLGGQGGTAGLLRAGATLGALAGLAVGSKLNGALVGIAVATWIPLLWASESPERRRPLLAGTVPAFGAAGGVALLGFGLLTPAVWTGPPLEGLSELRQRWAWNMAQQQRREDRSEVALELSERVGMAAEGALVRDEPLHALTGLPGGWVLLGIGLAWLAVRAIRRSEFGDRAAARATLAWILVVVAGTTLWLPLDRARFFLPYLPCTILLEALVVGSLWGRLLRLRG